VERGQEARTHQIFVRLPRGPLQTILTDHRPHEELCEVMRDACGWAPRFPVGTTSELFRAGSTGAFIITFPSTLDMRLYLREKSLFFSRLAYHHRLRGISIQARRPTKPRCTSPAHEQTAACPEQQLAQTPTIGADHRQPTPAPTRILQRGEELSPNAPAYEPDANRPRLKQQSATGRSQ